MEFCCSGVTEERQLNVTIEKYFHGFKGVSLPERVFHSSQFGWGKLLPLAVELNIPPFPKTVLQLESKSFWFVSIVYLPAQSQYKYYSSSKHLAWNTSLSLLNHLILHLLKPLLEIHNILDFWACTTKTRMQLWFPLLARHAVGTKSQAVLEPQGVQARWMSYPRKPRASPWQQAIHDVMIRLSGESTLFSHAPSHSPGRWHGHPEHLPEVQAWIMHPEGTEGEAHKDPLLGATITKNQTFPTATASCSQDKCLWHVFYWSRLLGLWWESTLQLHSTQL